MFNILNLDTNVIELYQALATGSDVFFLRRNEGLLGHTSIQERGQAAEERLARSFARIAGDEHYDKVSQQCLRHE